MSAPYDVIRSKNTLGILLTIREKKRNWLVIVLVSLIVPTFVYVLFRQQFFLMLPVGICKYIPINILR